MSPDLHADPYLWLEDVTGEDALAWVRERNDETLASLTGGPGFDEVRDGLRAVLDSDERIPYVRRRGELFYNYWQDAAHPKGLWRRTTLDSYRTGDPEWEVLIDLDALAADEDENWVWAGGAVLYPDYERALVQLSRGGADATVVREFDLPSKTFVSDGFVLPEAKHRITWIDRDTVFVGTDLGEGSLTTSGYPRVIRRWTRGTPVADAPVVFEAEPTDVSAFVWHDDTPGYERDVVGRSPDFHTSERYVVRDDGSHLLVDIPADAGADLERDMLLVRPRTDWAVEGTDGTVHPAGSLVVFDLEDYLAGGREGRVLFAPTPHRSLSHWHWTRNHLVLSVLDDVVTHLEVLTPARDWASRELPAGPAFSSPGIIYSDSRRDDEYLIDTDGFTLPSTLMRGDLADPDTPPETLRQAPSFFDASGMTVRQLFATSDDGTAIPYFVVGDPSSQGPTLMTGYGGFEISLTPSYSGVVGSGWLERGGTYVVANIRGGGEYGPSWHTSALRENRPRAYADFAAVARDLVERGITTRERLAIEGGSNGGLLTGVMLTRYPELFGAIVIMVPLLDMRRYHLLPAGASWTAEYGDPDTSDWDFISRYSPYQNVRADADYPPVLVTTSTRDDRVHPGHARKMVARLREQGHRVEYYENVEGGHGGAADNAQRAFQWALVFEFCRRELG